MYSVKVLEVLGVLENQKQIVHGIDKVVNDSLHTANLSSTLPNYEYTKEDIDNFFASDNGQMKSIPPEANIGMSLIGQQSYKPFFYYCKKHSNIENIYLKSIEDHIRLQDPQRHKAKLLELVDNRIFVKTIKIDVTKIDNKQQK
jgi:hypothetical protein